MSTTGRQVGAETELMQALARVRESRPGIDACPNRNLLKQFFDGKVLDENVQNRILRHLDSCHACVKTLKELRDSRVRMRRILLAAAAAILVIGVLLKVWPAQDTERDTAAIELHTSEVLRGVEPTLTLPRSTKRLRIIFPEEEQPGVYELRLLKSEAEAFPLIEAQGATRGDRHNLELNVNFNISRLPAGAYVLAFRRSSLGWQYRPLRIE